MVCAIAGCVLLAATLLAAFAHPLWVLLVVVDAADSILVSLTGLGMVGSTLARLGFAPTLARPGWSPGQPYRTQTDVWYLERCIHLVVETNLTIASILSIVHSPWCCSSPLRRRRDGLVRGARAFASWPTASVGSARSRASFPNAKRA